MVPFKRSAAENPIFYFHVNFLLTKIDSLVKKNNGEGAFSSSHGDKPNASLPFIRIGLWRRSKLQPPVAKNNLDLFWPKKESISIKTDSILKHRNIFFLMAIFVEI